MRPVKIKKWTGQPWRYAHVKRDGMWITVRKLATGKVELWTRYPSLVEYDLSWSGDWRALEFLPNDSVLYGEAYVVGGNREDVKGAMRDRDSRLCLEFFAIERWDGLQVKAEMPLPVLKDMVETCACRFVPYYTREESLQNAHVPEKLPGTEGWVLKDGNLLNWYKVKDADTWDLRVVSWTPGRGKYRGLLGALICNDASGREVRVSGMSDSQREDWARDFGLVRGKIVEVEAQGVGSAGGLCHPRFVAIRDDKTEPDFIRQQETSDAMV